jgi:hypothetical protein
MADRMSELENLSTELSGNLDNTDPAVGNTVAARLGDLFEHLLVSQATVDSSVCRSAAERILKRALIEQCIEVQETALSALVDAAALPACASIDWSLLVQTLPFLNQRLVEYALQIIAFTHDLQYEPVIKRFCDHPDPLIRETADESLVELHGRQT